MQVFKVSIYPSPSRFPSSSLSTGLQYDDQNQEVNISINYQLKTLLEKTLMLRKIRGQRRRGRQRLRWLDNVANPVDMNLHKLQDMAKDREAWRAAVCRIAEAHTTKQLNNKQRRPY